MAEGSVSVVPQTQPISHLGEVELDVIENRFLETFVREGLVISVLMLWDTYSFELHTVRALRSPLRISTSSS